MILTYNTRMSIERSRAMVPVPEQEPEATIIDSSNITDFLLYGDLNSSAKIQFASELSMSSYTPVFEYLYGEKKLGYIFDEEVRTSHLNFDDIPDNFRSIYEAAEEERIKIYSEKVDVERSSIVFYDPEEKRFYNSSAKHGEVFSTISEAYEIARNGNFPMLEIHTHPSDHFFSPVDFSRLLHTFPHGKRRVVNGLVLLCPEWQILALPTSQTPTYSYEEMKNKITENKEKYSKENRREEQLHNRVKYIKEELGERGVWKIYGKWSKKALTENASRIKNREITEDEFIQIWTDEYQSLIDEDLNLHRKKFERIFSKSATQLYSHIHRGINTRNIDFVREINVKLYASEDMKNFREFSL